MINEGHNRVLVVMSDPMPPAVYQEHWDTEPAGYGLGLMLESSAGETFELSLWEAESKEDSIPPQALIFLKMLAGHKKSAFWQRGSRRWTWERL